MEERSGQNPSLAGSGRHEQVAIRRRHKHRADLIRERASADGSGIRALPLVQAGPRALVAETLRPEREIGNEEDCLFCVHRRCPDRTNYPCTAERARQRTSTDVISKDADSYSAVQHGRGNHAGR